MLLLHLLARVLADILDDGVDHISDDRENGDEEEKEDEGEDVVLGLCHCEGTGGFVAGREWVMNLFDRGAKGCVAGGVWSLFWALLPGGRAGTIPVYGKLE